MSFCYMLLFVSVFCVCFWFETVQGGLILSEKGLIDYFFFIYIAFVKDIFLDVFLSDDYRV